MGKLPAYKHIIGYALVDWMTAFNEREGAVFDCLAPGEDVSDTCCLIT